LSFVNVIQSSNAVFGSIVKLVFRHGWSNSSSNAWSEFVICSPADQQCYGTVCSLCVS